jgi:hypothetical protein
MPCNRAPQYWLWVFYRSRMCGRAADGVVVTLRRCSIRYRRVEVSVRMPSFSQKRNTNTARRVFLRWRRYERIRFFNGKIFVQGAVGTVVQHNCAPAFTGAQLNFVWGAQKLQRLPPIPGAAHHARRIRVVIRGFLLLDRARGTHLANGVDDIVHRA